MSSTNTKKTAAGGHQHQATQAESSSIKPPPRRRYPQQKHGNMEAVGAKQDKQRATAQSFDDFIPENKMSSWEELDITKASTLKRRTSQRVKDKAKGAMPGFILKHLKRTEWPLHPVGKGKGKEREKTIE